MRFQKMIVSAGIPSIGASDTINLRVAVRPKTREKALALARDQYLYCSDNIDQGVGTSSALAATLMESSSMMLNKRGSEMDKSRS